MEWLGKRAFDLVIATEWAPAALSDYVKEGGKLLLVSASAPEFEVAPVIRTDKDVQGYIRIRDASRYPSLKQTDLLMLNGPFTTVNAAGPHSLTLIPPSMIGPPEFIHIDMKETDTPGLVEVPMGKGSVVWVPWNLGGLYYRHSLPAHAGLFRDLVDRLQPRRQVLTNAHPLVEMSLMRQGSRTLLHLVNLSGQSQTGYFAPLPMTELRVQVMGDFKRVRAVRSDTYLPVKRHGGYTDVVLNRLDHYELLVFE